MSQLLEFSLGIQTSEFLSKLGFAEGELLSFAGLAETVRSAWEHTWSAMERGASLQNLSTTLGESVSQIYSFQTALHSVGGEFSSTFFLQVEKSLAGVNEQGVRTEGVFAKLGLDLGKLRGEDTVTAITQIATALSKLNNTNAAGIAEMLFGRFGAESILQISHNLAAFQEEMRHSAAMGDLFEKFGDAFKQVLVDWDHITEDVQSVWTAIAGEIAPELHRILSEVDDKISNLGPALVGAFQNGRLREFLMDLMAAAWEAFRNYGEASIAFIGTFLGDTLGTVFTVALQDIPDIIATSVGNAAWIGAAKIAQSSDKANVQNNREQIKRLQGMTDEQFLNETGWSGQTRQGAITALKAQADQSQADIAVQQGIIDNLFSDTATKFKTDIVDSMKQLGESISQGAQDGSIAFSSILANAAWPALFTLEQFNKANPVKLPHGSNANSNNSNSVEVANVWHPEFTSLEKMGFVMNGGHGPDRMVELLTKIEQNTNPQRVGKGWGANDPGHRIRDSILQTDGFGHATHQL